MATARADRAGREHREQAALTVLTALIDPKTSDSDAAYLMRAIGPQLANAA